MIVSHHTARASVKASRVGDTRYNHTADGLRRPPTFPLALGKVAPPSWVEWIRVLPDLDMTANRHSRHLEQVAPSIDMGVAERPVFPTHANEVAVLDPLLPLSRMAALCPSPEALPYFVVYTDERGLAGAVAIIIRPAQQDWVQAVNQLEGIAAFDPATHDNLPNPIQQAFDALL